VTKVNDTYFFLLFAAEGFSAVAAVVLPRATVAFRTAAEEFGTPADAFEVAVRGRFVGIAGSSSE
jgi:hypothetical protein